MRVKRSSKASHGTNSILVMFLGAVFCKQLCLFLVHLSSSSVNFLLSFGAFKSGLGEKGHYQKLYVPTAPSGRHSPKSSSSPLLADSSFSSQRKVFIWSFAAMRHSVLHICSRKKERMMKSSVFARVLVHPFPLAFLAPAGCLPEHCNSWHCITCPWKRLV